MCGGGGASLCLCVHVHVCVQIYVGLSKEVGVGVEMCGLTPLPPSWLRGKVDRDLSQSHRI